MNRFEQKGILQKVNNSYLAVPIVAVPKKDGRFRICGNYKVTINQVLSVEQYSLPKPDELFGTLAKENFFQVRSLSGILTLTA